MATGLLEKRVVSRVLSKDIGGDELSTVIVGIES